MGKKDAWRFDNSRAEEAGRPMKYTDAKDARDESGFPSYREPDETDRSEPEPKTPGPIKKNTGAIVWIPVCLVIILILYFFGIVWAGNQLANVF